MFKDIIKTLKVNHYIKNLIVFVPLIFSVSFMNTNLLFRSLEIFLAFCLISSAVYVLNDLIDIENDRNHPIKSKRPIASGKISKPFAILMMLLLLIFSSLISLKINIHTMLSILVYFILNIFYSLWLKNIVLIDSTCIALGFVLRVLGGCFAISVVPSPLVILMTFFVSNFFTSTKRKMELRLLGREGKWRKSLIGMDENCMTQFVLINIILSIAFYITYVLDSTTISRAGSQYLYLTVIPFTLIIYRLFFLVCSTHTADDPIVFIENDKILKVLFVVYLVVLGLVLTILK